MQQVIKGLLAIPVKLMGILGLFLGFSYLNSLSSTFALFNYYFIYLFLFGLAVLSRWFRRHRVFLVLSFLLFFRLPLDLTALSNNESVLVGGLTILLPPNLLLLGLFPQEQMRLRQRSILFTFLLIQVSALFWLGQALAGNALRGLEQAIFLPKLPSIGYLPGEAALLTMLCAIVSIFNQLFSPGDFSSLTVNLILSTSLYNYMAPLAGLPLDALFFVLVLFLTGHILQDNYRAAYVDQLTGIPGRRALFEKAGQLPPDYVVAMVDIDFFKKFNDRYGHDVGDDVLAFVASILTKTAQGAVFRYGGEEFAILFPKKEFNECIKHLDEVREAVAASKFKLRRGTGKHGSKTTAVTVTVSIGAAPSSDKNRSFSEVLKAADKALYRAKRKGRNCVSK